MNGWKDTLVVFEPGTKNPYLANYTSVYYNGGFTTEELNDITEGNGLLNGEMPDPIYGIVQMPGTTYNEFSRPITTRYVSQLLVLPILKIMKFHWVSNLKNEPTVHIPSPLIGYGIWPGHM
jgi:hypothetical protein